jgi:hypothetical protein
MPFLYAITEMDAIRASWLRVMPWRLYHAAMLGRWTAKCDAIDYELSHFGLGRN